MFASSSQVANVCLILLDDLDAMQNLAKSEETRDIASLEMLGGMRGSGKTTLCSVLQKVGAPDTP